MQRSTSLPLIAVALCTVVGCTRSAERGETDDMLDTGGAESTPPRGGATTTGSGDSETGGVGGRPSMGGAPDAESTPPRGGATTTGSGDSETGGVGGRASTSDPGGRPSMGGAPDPETGGAGGRPSSAAECVDTPPLVGACVIDSEGPFDSLRLEQLTLDGGVSPVGYNTWLEFAFEATVTDRGSAPPTADCWSRDNSASTRRESPDGDVTFVDLEDRDGKKWHFELVLPEYDASHFSIGDAVNAELLVWEESWDELGSGNGARYRIGRGEELLALVVQSTGSDIGVTRGTETCFTPDEEMYECGWSHYDMLASYGGEQVVIADGETREVGGLLVTNDAYYGVYDYGACHSTGGFTLGAQPTD